MIPPQDAGDTVGLDLNDIDFDISDFLGMPEYHDYELLSQNHLDTSICIYRAKGISSNKHFIIKVCTSPDDEENAMLEEEYRILTHLKQQIATHSASAAAAQRTIKRRSGSFLRKTSFSSAIKPLHTTIEESSLPLSHAFPCPVESRKVYGDQCVATVFEQFGGQTLESILSGTFSLADVDREMNSAPSQETNHIPISSLSITGSILDEDSSSFIVSGDAQPLFYESSVPFDHLVSVFWQLADVIDWLHRTKVAFQNLSPANIMIKRIQGRQYPVVQITNFSLARKFEKLGEVQDLLDFRYLSPEQTERMDRITDYRTDMYSFGLTMWEALTGTHPFANKESYEDMIYAHLTEKMADPRTINPIIPSQLVSIIEKLIQKNPADRYQLFSAVKFDLKEILDRLTAIKLDNGIPVSSNIPNELLMSNFDKWTNWNLAVKDFSPFLHFRSKTYGRKEQQAQIWTFFQNWSTQNVNDRRGLVLVLSGDYGTGKSAFAEELMITAHQKMMVFPIASKPTKLQQNAPYKAFRSILEQLVMYILGDSGISFWQSNLLSELGLDGLRILSTLVPSINLVFQELDFSRKIAPTQKIDLFRSVELFLSQFASFDNPLVMCLGELDAEDGNDSEMLAYLLSSTLTYRAFFVALLSPSQNLSSLLLPESKIAHVHIPPLALSDVLDFLDEILRPRLMEINSLATLLLQKSAGNLLFLKELVKHCEKLELINFDQNQLLWTWDLKKIESEVGLSTDVISLLSRQVESLPTTLKRLLFVAACIGLEFDVGLLSELVEEEVSSINTNLHLAVTKGYIQPLSIMSTSFSQSLDGLNLGSQKIGSTGSLSSNVGSFSGVAPPSTEIIQRAYKFCHRRIKEYLRTFVSRNEFQKFSLRIAQHLRKSKHDQRLTNEQSYELLLHYENSASMIEEDEDLLAYGYLLYDSGFQKGTSIEQHIVNFTNACKVAERIRKSTAEKEDLLFKIRASLSSLFIRANCLDKASQMLSLIKPSQDQNDRQSCHWTSLMVQLKIAENCFDDAITIGINSKNSVGDIFRASSLLNFEENLPNLAQLIPNKEDILNLHPDDSLIAFYVDEMIQNSTFICKSRGDSINAAFFFMLGARYSFTQGITENSSIYFAALVQYYAGSVFNYYSIAAAKSFGELSTSMMDGYSSEKKLSVFENLLTGNTLFWNYSDACEKMNSIIQANLDDIHVNQVIACMSNFYQLHLLPCGKSLAVARDIDRKFKNIEIFQKGDLNSWEICMRCYEEIASGFPIDQYEPLDTPLGKFNYYAQLLQSFLYFYPNRAELCSKFTEVLSDFRATWMYVDALLFATILKCEEVCQTSSNMSISEKIDMMETIDYYISQIGVYTQCQFSGEHRFKYSLAKAEKERALGNIKEGIEKYEEALEGAHTSGSILFIAWINELYANFWVSCNTRRLSKTFLQTSLTFWEQWGSDGKMNDIMGRFPEFFKRQQPGSFTGRRLSISGDSAVRRASSRYSNNHGTNPVDDAEQLSDQPQHSKQFSYGSSANSSRAPVDLDINTFLKVTNSITSEKDLDALVDKILQHLMSNTGATKAVILFSSKESMTIHKILTSSGNETFNEKEPHLHVPMALINYTTRVSESQVFSEVHKDPTFAGDVYIEAFSPKSIICCPMKHQNLTTGAIYLENRSQSGVFTMARVALVRSLMASASIAIANAHLEKKNMELSQALKESGKTKDAGPAYNVETPMQKVFDSIKAIKERFDAKDPIIKTLDLLLSTLTSDGLFTANLGEANDKDGKGIDQEVKNWVESSLLMTSKTHRGGKEEKDLSLPRSSITATLPTPPVILEESSPLGSHSLTVKSTPDPTLVDMEKIKAELELASSPSFDCFKLHDATDGRPLFYLANYMLKKYKLNTEFKLNPQTVDFFLQRIESSYNKLPYHNSIHATDVLQSVALILLDNAEISSRLTPLEIFSVCIASAVHDLDHPGINNNFLVKIGHPLAHLYNDNAVLESHHVAKAFEIAFSPKMMIFETMSPEQYTQCRKMIIQIVMATDLAQHFQFISKFNGKVASSSLNLEDENDRLLVMEMAVKCGDLGNPAKSFDQAKKWTNLVMEEFFRQGDREKQMGYPVSKFMDRADTNVSKCQIGFIDFLVAPLFNAWTSFSKTDFTKLCQENIENNRKQWHLAADTPNVLPGVTSSDYEALEDLINISFPSISFGKHSLNEAARRKSLRESTRKFSVGKFSTFSVSENEDRLKPISNANSPLASIAKQLNE